MSHRHPKLSEAVAKPQERRVTDFFSSIETCRALAHNPPCVERPDDFASRRARLAALSDEELHAYFWELAQKIVAPMIAEARTHTTPSIERSVLLRMGFSSIDAKALVNRMHERRLLGHGAGRLVLELAKSKGIAVREAGIALLSGRYWEDLGR